MVKKLLILIGFFSILLALTNFFYIRSLNNITKLSSSIVYDEIRCIKKLNDIREFFYTSVRHIKKFILTYDKDYFGFYIENYNKAKEKLAYLEKDFTFSDEERNIINEIDLNLKRFNGFILSERKGEPEERILKKIGGFADEVSSKIRQLKDEKEMVIDKKVNSVRASGESATKIGFLISVTTIVISLTFAMILIYVLIKSLKSLMEGTSEFSKGNFFHKIPLTKEDEMGLLAKAFNTMGEKLLSLDKMKNDFLSGVSHELRTPLTSMKEAIKLISDEVAGKVSEEQKKLLTIALNSNERMINLVNNLLELSKMRAGITPFNIEVSDIDPVIKLCVEESRLIAEKKSIKVNLEVNESIPSIPFDKNRISQMLSTLLTNAIKFTNENGKVSIRRKIKNGYLRIEIEDTGIGMSKEKLKLIFGENSKNSQYGYAPGFGLGLNIAREVVKAHNGEMKIESTEGVGTTVIVDLPLNNK